MMKEQGNDMDKVLKTINIIFPLIGMGLMIFYDACDTSCSYLQGTLLGIDLKIIGILFMAVLLAAALTPVSRYPILVDHLRTMMLSAAVGGKFYWSASRLWRTPTALSVWPSECAFWSCLQQISSG
jgi:uncharacterized membrane protein